MNNILTLTGQLGQILARESSDAEQLADLASALRIIREAVRDEEAAQRIDWLLTDIDSFARERAESERESEAEHHHYMRRSAAYRRANAEGTL